MDEQIQSVLGPSNRQLDSHQALSRIRLDLVGQANHLEEIDGMVRPLWRLLRIPALDHDNLRNEVIRREGSVPSQRDVSPPSTDPPMQSDRRAAVAAIRSDPLIRRGNFLSDSHYSHEELDMIDRHRMYMTGPSPAPRRPHQLTSSTESTPDVSAETSRSRTDTEVHARPALMRDDNEQQGTARSQMRSHGSSHSRIAEMYEEYQALHAQQAIRMAPPRPARPPSPEIVSEIALENSSDTPRNVGLRVDNRPPNGPTPMPILRTRPSSPGSDGSSSVSDVASNTTRTSSTLEVLATSPNSENIARLAGRDEESVEEGAPGAGTQARHRTATSGGNSARLTQANLRQSRSSSDHLSEPSRSPSGRDMGRHFSFNHDQVAAPQSFAGLAFSRLGYPSVPAQPSGPQEVDDQLGEMRGVIHRLAEGMDTMERLNQAWVYGWVY